MTSDDEAWFGGDQSTGISRMLRYSDVSFYVDAEEYYADLRHEVENAGLHGGTRFVCWIGFDASPSTPMPATAAAPTLKPFARRAAAAGDRAWIDVLASATNRGVGVRAMLNLHPSPKPHDRYLDANLSTVSKLNALKNTLAINDFRYLFMNGTHHQKLVLVKNDTELIAFVGTMDLHWQRIKDRWCEVGCKVHGEAARELYRVFYARWCEHTEELRGQPRERSWLPPPDDVHVRSAGGRLLTQAAVTLGRPTRPSPFGVLGQRQQVVNAPHRLTITAPVPVGISPFLSGGGLVLPATRVGNDFFLERDPVAPPLIAAARRQAEHYRKDGWVLSPEGRTGIYHQVAAALERVRRFVYVEDQYLVDDLPMGRLKSMLDLLIERLRHPGFKKLIVLCTRLDEIDAEFQGLAGPHRRAFVERLTAAGGDKVVICQYKSNAALRNGIEPAQNSPFYIHSKTWIFDDELLIVGSANCNRRGYSHDSELDLAVHDAEKNAVAQLRRKIWLSRLNTEAVSKPLTDREVRDFLAAARYWEKPQDFGLTIENHRIGIDAFVPRSAPDPAVVDNMGYGPVVDVLALAKAGVAEWMWGSVVDPDGT